MEIKRWYIVAFVAFVFVETLVLGILLGVVLALNRDTGNLHAPYLVSTPPPDFQQTQLENWIISSYWQINVAQWWYEIALVSQQYWIDPDLIAAVILVESNGNPSAMSHSGAIGLMQIMPRFHSCATFDPYGNILCGTHILAGLIQSNLGDVRKSLAEYHCGVTRVAQNRCDALGGWAYADKVLNFYRQAKGLAYLA